MPKTPFFEDSMDNIKQRLVKDKDGEIRSICQMYGKKYLLTVTLEEL